MKIRETCGPKEEPKVIKLGDLGMGEVFKLVDSGHAFMKSSSHPTIKYVYVVDLSTGATDYNWDRDIIISKVYPNAELILEGC